MYVCVRARVFAFAGVCVFEYVVLCVSHICAYLHTRTNIHTGTRAYLLIQTRVVEVVSVLLPRVMHPGVRASASLLCACLSPRLLFPPTFVDIPQHARTLQHPTQVGHPEFYQ